ncbi:MAG: acyltransferase, partial [Prevotella sp.]|nr:acyltransferase [Prevotella sp.]
QITIGNHLLTGTNVLITDNSHGATDYASLVVPPIERTVVSHGPVKIGNNVWLGNNVCVLPNVTIGDGAVVGANSVVTHDIPPYAIVAGIPAKIVKQVTP